MVQDQLVDYISSQLKANASRDTIKAALTGAGWEAADVEDTLKKVEGMSRPSPSVSAGAGAVGSPAGAAGGSAFGGGMAASAGTSSAKPAAAFGGISPMGQKTPPSSSGIGSSISPGAAGPQMIKMSDLVSSGLGGSKNISMDVKKESPHAMDPSTIKPAAFGSFAASSPARSPKTNPSAMGGSSMGSPSSGMGMNMSAAKPKSKSAIIAESLEAFVIVVVVIFAGYLYFKSQGLSNQLNALNGTSGSTVTDVTSLNAQIATLTASTTALGAQATSLTAENQDLLTELSFYAAPPGSSATAADITVTGVVSGGGKAPYVITTKYGAKVYVANSTDAKLGPELKALLGKTAAASGTLVPGSDSITLTSVTNPAAAAPMQIATSTASTTASSSASSSANGAASSSPANAS